MVTGSNVRRAREVIAALAPILRPRSLAGSTGSTIDGSSFSGLFTRVELGNLRDRSINDHSLGVRRREPRGGPIQLKISVEPSRRFGRVQLPVGPRAACRRTPDPVPGSAIHSTQGAGFRAQVQRLWTFIASANRAHLEGSIS
jgi:hypothetical protein